MSDRRRWPDGTTLFGSSIQHDGPVGFGALAKSATNALMGVQSTAVAELVGMLKTQGADPLSEAEALAWNGADHWHDRQNSGRILRGNTGHLEKLPRPVRFDGVIDDMPTRYRLSEREERRAPSSDD